MAKLTAAIVAALLAFASAHPGEHEEHGPSLVAKRAFITQTRRSLGDCAEHLERRGTLHKAEAHRRSLVERHRAELASSGKVNKARDTDDVLNTDHHSNLTGITIDTDSDVFYTESSCVLSPEGEIGPFWVSGELIREDILEDEPGVPNYMHAQFIDVNTCEPIEDLYWDVWNCNSTGVYSGVQSNSNGNGDASNLNNTALRGIQPTDEDGIATFKTLFPGHYSGRATHVHVVAHTNATVLANDTLSGGVVPHIGQFFFDQDLITQVEATSPYNTNEVAITENADDRVFLGETEDTDSDPVFEYVFLGDDLSDGIFSWITVGVDTTATYDTSAAAYWTSSGGVTNDSGSGGGGGGEGGGQPGGPQ